MLKSTASILVLSLVVESDLQGYDELIDYFLGASGKIWKLNFLLNFQNS